MSARGEYRVEIPPHPFNIAVTRIPQLNGDNWTRIRDFSTYNGKFDPSLVEKAAGRNIFFPLVEPFGMFDVAQVSGGGLFDYGLRDNSRAVLRLTAERKATEVIQPPKSNPERCIQATGVVSEGQLVEVISDSPLGSYTQKSAELKWANTMHAGVLALDQHAPFLTPLLLAQIRYQDIPDGEGGQQTSLVFGCPLGGVRMDDLFSNMLNIAAAERDQEVRNQRYGEYFTAVFFPAMEQAGKSLRFLHERGICHYQLTLGNMSPAIDLLDERSMCIYDWHTMRKIDAQNPRLSKALDLSGPIRSLSHMIRFILDQELIDDRVVALLGYSAALSVLGGYLGIGGKTLDGELNLSDRDRFLLTLEPDHILKIVKELVIDRFDKN